MKLTFLGAAREVTGSCYYLETESGRILIDCGMEQGRDIYENQPLPVSPGEIDCVLLTHAHIDHSGKLPLLYAQGFRGPIYATTPTSELCDLMLRDSAHIQEFEAEWRNRKAKRSGGREYVPLYTMKDALGAIGLFQSVPYGQDKTVLPGVTAHFTDAGHLLGSASINLTVSENGKDTRIVFSGDIGNTHQPILSDPIVPEPADFVVMESTYGDRTHGPRPDYIASLTRVIQETFDRGGNVVIPSFAVGRTQEMLYFIRQIKAERRVKGHDGFTVYVDSPLANEATNVFRKTEGTCFDEETRALLSQGINPLTFPGLRASVTSDDSKAINADRSCSVILSASGMCEAGRIRHHLKHNLWRPESTVLFVGYQAEGTVGRALLEGAKTVKLFGEEIEVRASIQTLAAVSGHADNEGLMHWAGALKEKPARVFVTHGDEASALALTARLRDELHIDAVAPYNGERWALPQNEMIAQGNQTPIEDSADQRAKKAAGKAPYERLLAAAKRLSALAARCEGLSNKLLGKFADQINALCEKWEK